MARYPQGQPVRVSTTVTDVNGNPLNAGTLTLVVKLWNADGTTTTSGTYASPVNDSTGAYHQDVPAADITTIGHYQYAWTATGTGAGVSSPAEFDVFDPFETAVLTLQDAKALLKIPATTTTYDAELQSWIATIENSIEGYTGGPLANRTITERIEITAGYTVLVVRQRPLVSLTSVVSASSGQALTITDMTDIDYNAGTIRRALGIPFIGPYFTWLPIFNVTYVAGWGVQVPATFSSVARIVLKHLWEAERGAAASPLLGGEETVSMPGWGYAIPARAAELLEGTFNGMPFRCEAFV